MCPAVALLQAPQRYRNRIPISEWCSAQGSLTFFRKCLLSRERVICEDLAPTSEGESAGRAEKRADGRDAGRYDSKVSFCTTL